MEVIAALGTFVLSAIMIVALLRLFSIDRTLKSILAELSRQNLSAIPSPATPVQGTEAQRARSADVQKNWPGYK